VDPHVPDPETDPSAAYVGVLAHQVRHQQRLRVDEVVTAGQLAVGEPEPLAVEAELARGVQLRAVQQVPGEPALLQAPHGPFLDDSGPGPLFDELPGLGLQDQAVHGRRPQDVADGQPRGTGAHDDDRNAVRGR
jgi:hypothetical protein